MDNRTTNSSSVYMFEGHTLVDRVLMLTGPSTGLIITICSSIVLNTFLKELNSTIKILFNILLVHNFIIFVTGISTVAYAIITENQTTELCIIHYHTTIPSTMVNFESMNILSIINSHDQHVFYFKLQSLAALMITYKVNDCVNITHSCRAKKLIPKYLKVCVSWFPELLENFDTLKTAGPYFSTTKRFFKGKT